MNFNIDQLHPLVLNVGLATHNGDWTGKASLVLLIEFTM